MKFVLIAIHNPHETEFSNASTHGKRKNSSQLTKYFRTSKLRISHLSAHRVLPLVNYVLEITCCSQFFLFIDSAQATLQIENCITNHLDALKRRIFPPPYSQIIT